MIQTVTLEEVRDILQLGDVVFAVATVFGQQGEVLQVLLAGVAGVELFELLEHHPPGTHLLCCEVYAKNRIATDQTSRVRYQNTALKEIKYTSRGNDVAMF